MRMQHSRPPHGFTLVEMSIVLVIIGLITGGILTGQSLIVAAEQRSIMTQFSEFTGAVQVFRSQYESLPGDFPTATDVWGKDNTNCSTDAGTAATPGTCNGDGNNIVNVFTGNATDDYEAFRFWQQLTLAGLIPNSYTGLTGGGGAMHAVPGSNVPAGKIANSGWSNAGLGTYTAGGSNYFARDYGNTLYFGAATATALSYGALLTPKQVATIDRKYDDGMPYTGKIAIMYYSACTNAADRYDTTASYTVSSSGVNCAILFPNAF